MAEITEIFFYATVYVTLFVSIFWFTTYFFSDKKGRKTRAQRPLSVIIPAYNEEASIERCVKSLLAQRYPNLDIIIVDDGSTDRTGETAGNLAGAHKNIKYIRKRHSGKAASLNAGLRHVKTELFGFIDSDTYLSKNALKNMTGYINSDVVSVIASIRPYKPKTTVEKIQQVEYLISSFTRRLMSFIDSLYYTPGFAIYRTDVLRRLGGFDEGNLTEDLEIGLRLKDQGYKIEHSASDYAETDVPKTFRGLFRQRMRWYRGYIYNTRKYSHMFFNRRFSDLGILVLPLQYLLLALIIPFFMLSIYDNFVLLAQRIADVFVVEFDLAYIASTMRISFINATTFFFITILLAFAMMIRLSEHSIKDKISKMDYAVYIILYPFINLALWISAFVCEITRAKKEW